MARKYELISVSRNFSRKICKELLRDGTHRLDLDGSVGGYVKGKNLQGVERAQGQ